MRISHRRILGLAAGVTCVLATACSGSGRLNGDSPSAAPSSAAAVASSTPSATTAQSASPSATADTRPLQGLLPSDFGGSEAHTFAVGPDMLARLVEEMEVGSAELEVAFASDHSAAFVQMYALRVAGHSADEILAALAPAAYPDASPESISVTQQTMGARTVTIIRQPDQAEQVGTFYCLADGQVLIVAQAFTEAVAAAAFEELPPASPRDY